MKIYFVRHGESVLNATNTHQFSDTPLSPHGEKQAQFVAERFLALPIEKIYASDYMRAKQTAEAIAQTTGKPLLFSELIRERRRPSVLFGKSNDDKEGNKIKDLLTKHAEEKEWHYSDEENFHDFINRATDFITQLESEEKAGTNHVAVVTHGAFLRMIVLSAMLNSKVTSQLFESFYEFAKVTNTGITVCEYKKSKWSLLTWNDYAHLGD